MSVPRERILEVTLVYGTGAQRPIVQAAVSLIIVILGIFLGVLPLYHVLSKGMSNYNLKGFAFALLLVPIGIWLLIEVLQRKYYLLVKTDKRAQKVVFKSSTKASEISEFIKKAQEDFGYNINIKRGKGVRL